jgi:uncharacterized protein (DUF1499 family)
MRTIGLIVMLMFTAIVGAILAGQLGMLQGTAPDDLGVRNGRLKPPAVTPNSVSSQANLYPDHPQRLTAMVAPFPAGSDGNKSLDKIEKILKNLGNTQIVRSESGYLYAQSTTPLMRFTDDLEFWLDTENGVIHVRSASRLGESDLGANRKRVETIRAQFLQN